MLYNISQPSWVLQDVPTIVFHTIPTIVFHTIPTIVFHTIPTLVFHTIPTPVFHTDPTPFFYPKPRFLQQCVNVARPCPQCKNLDNNNANSMNPHLLVVQRAYSIHILKMCSRCQALSPV